VYDDVTYMYDDVTYTHICTCTVTQVNALYEVFEQKIQEQDEAFRALLGTHSGKCLCLVVFAQPSHYELTFENVC